MVGGYLRERYIFSDGSSSSEKEIIKNSFFFFYFREHEKHPHPGSSKTVTEKLQTPIDPAGIRQDTQN